jgi:hypothetical protein
MERKTKHPFRKEQIQIVNGNPFNEGGGVFDQQKPPSQINTETEMILVFNCAWHNPKGSKGRTALELSLKPNEYITDGICGDCENKFFPK